MENLTLSVEKEAYDRLVHGGPGDEVLAQHGNAIEIAAKPNALVSGAGAVVISFFAALPDENADDGVRKVRVQATTTRKLWLAAAKVIEYHPDLQAGSSPN